jgi:hypothetical protein
MRADRLLELEPKPAPYGPSLSVTRLGEKQMKRWPKTLRRYGGKLQFVADALSSEGVAGLEQLATALYVTLEGGVGEDVDRRAQWIRGLKPHVVSEDARKAVEEVDRIIAEARRLNAA